MKFIESRYVCSIDSDHINEDTQNRTKIFGSMVSLDQIRRIDIIKDNYDSNYVLTADYGAPDGSWIKLASYNTLKDAVDNYNKFPIGFKIKEI